jgi:hypothetical protein
MFQESLRRLRLRHKTSAWASGGPAGGRRAAASLGRLRALPYATQRAALNGSIFASTCLGKDATHKAARKSPNFQFNPATTSSEPPFSVAAFVVNSEPQTGAPPSVRSCAG